MRKIFKLICLLGVATCMSAQGTEEIAHRKLASGIISATGAFASVALAKSPKLSEKGLSFLGFNLDEAQTLINLFTVLNSLELLGFKTLDWLPVLAMAIGIIKLSNYAKHSFGDVIPPSMQKYVALAVAFQFITLFSALKLFEIEGRVSKAMSDFMGMFFAIFGAFKLMDYQAFVNKYKEYDLIAMRSAIYAQMYPFIEIALGSMYLSNVSGRLINILTTILSTVGVLSALRKIRSGSHCCECKCMGSALNVPVGLVTVSENVIMLAMALVMIFGE